MKTSLLQTGDFIIYGDMVQWLRAMTVRGSSFKTVSVSLNQMSLKMGTATQPA